MGMVTSALIVRPVTAMTPDKHYSPLQSIHIVNSPINGVCPFNNLFLYLILVKRALREP
jgi:hypothetical protein